MDIRLNNPVILDRRHIGICASQEYTVGLFEVLRIEHRIESIVWIRAVVSPFRDWIRACAQLTDDLPLVSTDERINLLCGNHFRLDQIGRVSASLRRIPYTVSFWDPSECFPVYTLFPDNRLPWLHTVRSAYMLPFMVAPPPRLGTVYAPRVPRDLAADAVCAITLEPLTPADAHWTSCGHAFSSAIFRALETSPRCPLCRAPCSAADIEMSS
jgi:hypothetical protein